MLSSCGLESPWAGHYVAVVVYGNFRASTTWFTVSLFTFLGRLPKVDPNSIEGKNVRPPVRPYLRTSVRPQKVSSI